MYCEMLTSNYIVAVFLIYVSFTEGNKIEDSVSPFGEKVKSIISDDIYQKIFAVNIKSSDDLLKILDLSIGKLEEILGSKVNNAVKKELMYETKRLGLSVLSPSYIFRINANTVAETLMEDGILTSDNVDNLAHGWVNELNKSATSLDNDDISSTFPALTSAIARFLKSSDLTLKDPGSQFVRNFIKEQKKN